MHVKLFTRDGGFVHEADILPFAPPPEMLQWGSRLFVRVDPNGEPPQPSAAYVCYIEGLLWVLP